MRHLEVDKKSIRLTFPYDAELIRRIKVGFKNASWNANNKVWKIPRDGFNDARLKSLLDDYEFTPFPEEEEFKDISSVGIPSVSEMSIIKDIIANDMEVKLTPRDYQLYGITYMLKQKVCINGDDMGLGKTGQTILATEVGMLFPCLVIAPSGVKFNWKKEWGKWIDGRSVSVIDGKKKDFSSDVVSISYGLLGTNMKELLKIPWKSIAIDESHNVKNGKAQRTKHVKKLCKKVEYVFLLSGTAIMNKPSELISQFEIMKVLDLFGGWKSFIYTFCDATNTPFGLDYSGASNTFELNKRMRELCYVRREKHEVAKDIPEILEQVIEIEATNKKDYNWASADIIGYIEKTEGNEAAIKASNAEHLVMISKLRSLSIQGKMKGIIDWIDNFLESSNEKLVVFGISTEPLERLSKKYNSSLVYGGTSAKDKLKLIEDFQTSQDRLIFGNIMSMGTGVDGLQDVSSHMLVLQLPDVPAILEQAKSRLHRTGQKKPVNVYKAFSDNGIDYLMWDILMDKYQWTEAVNRGKKMKAKSTTSMDAELMKRLKK